MNLQGIIAVLNKKNESKTAKILLDTLAKHASNHLEYDALGQCYNEIKQYALAAKYTERSLIMAPTNEAMYATRINLAKVYNHLNYPERALDYLKINEQLDPTDLENQLEKSFSLFLNGQRLESEKLLRELEKNTQLADSVRSRIRFNLGTHDLYHGRFKEGLAAFLTEGSSLKLRKTVKLPFKFWDGIARPGKHLLLVAEGGIGDELIHVRFCENIRRLGMIPLWYTEQEDLRQIFTRMGIDCIKAVADAPVDSFWIYSMSIPLFLAIDENQLWTHHYLTPDPVFVKKWEQISRSPKTKIGLRWAGNMKYDQDLHRSLPILALYDKIKNPACEYYSLQRDEGAELINGLPGVIDLQERLTTLEDTLAVIHHLDVIITSCTAIAHAAAAMGKRTIVLVPITAYYVWIGNHWYGDNVTVLFQTKCRNWDEPIQQLKELLLSTTPP